MQDDIRDTRDRQDTPAPRATETHIGPNHQLPPPKRSGGIRILVWLVILLLFGLLFWWVWHRKPAAAAAPAGGRRAAAGGTVTLTPATAKKGNIGVYLDAIGTVTPVYTTTLVSQVTGVITQVRYREGQLVHRGQPLIQIDPRPFQANVLTAQGALERDTNLLAQAEMDLKRYQDAWARNAIPKQTLDDQEKVVLQDRGHGQSRSGHAAIRPGATWALPTSPRPSPAASVCAWSIPAISPLPRAQQPLAVVTQIQPITVVFTIPEDNVSRLQQQMGHRQGAGVDALDRSERDQAGIGNAGSYRQPDRHHNRNVETARALREQRQCALSQSVRQRPPAAEHARKTWS